MDRAELIDALEELEGRLDVAQMDDDQYTRLSDAVAELKDLVARRVL